MTRFRRPILCPACRVALAYVRPEWLVLRRFLATEAARTIERRGSTITITCQCGHVHRVEWDVLQF